MTHSSTPLNHDENRKRFKKASKFFIGLGFFIFLISLSFYSPSADEFSLRNSLFMLLVTGILLGGLVALMGTIISGFLLAPRSSTPSTKKEMPLETSNDEPSLAINEIESPQPYQYDDWYNDVTNPISPIYQITHRSH